MYLYLYLQARDMGPLLPGQDALTSIRMECALLRLQSERAL